MQKYEKKLAIMNPTIGCHQSILYLFLTNRKKKKISTLNIILQNTDTFN